MTNKKFFIFCPLVVTGGPEALHQVCSELNDLGYDAYMYYYDMNTYHKICDCVLPDYAHYNIKISPYNTVDELNNLDNILIVPEIFPLSIFNFEYSAKVICWLLSCAPQTLSKLYENVELKNFYIGCCTDESYKRIVSSTYIDKKKCFYLRDYTRQHFIFDENELKKFYRDNNIIFNPIKGYDHTQKIISLMPEYRFIPITNMNSMQVRNLGLNSKVYIDFGYFPGRERIPREMGITGCVVITGSENVAINDVDVPTGKRKFEYDVETNSYDYQKIANQIKNDLENYEICFNEQFYYRELIRNEKNVVINDVKNMIDLFENV